MKTLCERLVRAEEEPLGDLREEASRAGKVVTGDVFSS
jgi:hypothetical protein